MAKRLLVMAGGTGGHVFPGLAVAKKLQAEGWEIRWLGTEDRMEAELVPAHGIEIDFIRISGLRGQKLTKLITAPFKIISAILQAKKYIKAWQPDVVLGMGGYVSGPGGIAAWLCGVPVVLHEQNAVAGLTNQWLSRIAKKVFQAFPGAFKDAEVVGNPVRDDVVALTEPKSKASGEPLNILVMGGSQGARILNQVVPPVAQKMADKAHIYHQVGKGNLASVREAYKDCDTKNYEVTEFIQDVAKAYEWADLIICRSGALTVSEVSAAGVAAIFVPFMHKDKQQAKNAKQLVEADAAILIEQPDFSVESLTQALVQLDNTRLFNMANRARETAIVDAADRVANEIKRLAE